MADKNSKFLLLQVNDALFPIGGYSHSYGLETYIQKGIVHDEKTAQEFIYKRLKYNFLYNELLTVRLAFEAAKAGNLNKIARLEEIVDAGKLPRETRDASRKLGSRFVKTMGGVSAQLASDVFERYMKSRERMSTHHAVVYGVFCSAAGISEDETLEHFIYAQTSAMVTNCVKTVPLSQSAGQRILTQTYELLGELADVVKLLGEEWLGLSGPGFDLRCMQHEGLYSRLFMS